MRKDGSTSHMVPADIPADRLDVVRVFLYARQSSARADGSEVSTEAQLAAGRALAEARSQQGVPWVVVGEFVDVGRSGWDPNVVRSDFEDMMRGVRDGEADVVIVNELSRLTRKGAHDALEIDKEFKKHAVRFMSILEPFLDTSTAIGVAIFALIAALAKQDSDIKAERLKGAKDEISAVGGRHSSSAPYGMKTVRKQIDNLVVSVLEPDEDNPEHVKTVERIIEMCFNGKADNKIATLLEGDGVPAPGNAKRRATPKRMESIKKRRISEKDAPIRWRAQTVAWILDHPAIGGFASERVKRGKSYVNAVARDSTGAPLTPHKGIITGAKWLQLQEVRKKPTKANRQPGGESDPTLMSGWRFLTCRLCGGSAGQTPSTSGGGSYMCSNPKGHGGLSIKREAADDYVAQRVWSRLLTADIENEDERHWLAAAALRFARQHDLAGVEEERRETQAHLDHVRESIHELQADRKAGVYRGSQELAVFRATIEQYHAYEDQCVGRLKELDEKTSASVRIPDEWLAPTEDDNVIGPKSHWAKWDVFKRREFLDLFLEGVSIGPGRDEDKKIIPVERRLKLTWRRLPKEDEESAEEDATAELAATPAV
ncbi:recombinase family protein [Streptomyces sp. NRRL S-920]|uniref:recombinase family protein n=1 Tax=Streptomyces sp. NRRL S-920 TaxID=1463921 RepID=UPI00068F897B|nr:recombinase family protein [Streptomyces sp. NRRL S-920]